MKASIEIKLDITKEEIEKCIGHAIGWDDESELVWWVRKYIREYLERKGDFGINRFNEDNDYQKNVVSFAYDDAIKELKSISCFNPFEQ